MRIEVISLCLVLASGTIASAKDDKNVQPLGSTQGAKGIFYDPGILGYGAGAIQEKQAEPGSIVKPLQTDSPNQGVANERLRQAQPATDGPGADSLGLHTWVELVDRATGVSSPVPTARTFQSGEQIRLHFHTNCDGYLAILQIASPGQASFLFPDPEKGLTDSRIKANKERVLPGIHSWFTFDDQPGLEQVIVVFAREEGDLPERPANSPGLNIAATRSLQSNAIRGEGSKDLFIETESETDGEFGDFAVSISGQPITVCIRLKHE